MSWPKITFFGDSQTRRSMDPDTGCWIGYIAHKIAHYFQVDIRGFDGYNSKWCLELMPKLFPKSYLENVEIFTIFLGHNDAWDPLWEPMHVPLEQFEKNMRAIIKYLNDYGIDNSKIILISPSWYDPLTFKRLSDPNLPLLTKEHANQLKYAEVIKSIAKEESIDLLDFMTIVDEQPNISEIFCDGLHLSPTGSRLLFNSIMPIIDNKIKTNHHKSIDELWHVVPLEQHPEVMPVLEHYKKLAISKNQVQ